MKITNGYERLWAGIDFRGEYPEVCYQTAQMKEPELLPLDFGGRSGRGACFRKILSALKRYGRKEDIRAAVVLPDMSEEDIRQYLQDACEAGFVREQLQVLGELESVVHFVMHQTNDIWQQQVWLLEFDTDEVKATSLQVNKRTTPMLVQAQEPEYWHVGSLLEGNRDEQLADMAKKRFGRYQVSAVFLTGTDFNARDYRKSREEICFRRRVFLGEQIHARGACVLAGDGEKRKPYLFLNEQTLLYNVGIRSSRAGKELIHTLVSAGCSWYEVQESCEMILLGEPLLEFSFQSMLGGEPHLAGLMLNGLPKRPEGTTRLLVEIHFSGPRQCEVQVSDLGFGEIYPASDLYWKETFLLEEEEENHGAGYDL
ncbi:MAG: hypothetical protein KH452_03650 [Clostridiales bacterium]|nr:hypothetical protein [Clostridiales bacterium]